MGVYIVFCCFLFGDLSMFVLGQMVSMVAYSMMSYPLITRRSC
jgi:hypothetical protein